MLELFRVNKKKKQIKSFSEVMLNDSKEDEWAQIPNNIVYVCCVLVIINYNFFLYSEQTKRFIKNKTKYNQEKKNTQTVLNTDRRKSFFFFLVVFHCLSRTNFLFFTKSKMYKSNDIKHFTLTLTVLVLSCIPLISAHVALTYPPARKYDLDFLDNSRTKGPCGMPKG